MKGENVLKLLELETLEFETELKSLSEVRWDNTDKVIVGLKVWFLITLNKYFTNLIKENQPEPEKEPKPQEIEVGDCVAHWKYGYGVVEGVNLNIINAYYFAIGRIEETTKDVVELIRKRSNDG